MGKDAKKQRMPKKECCLDRPRCSRCPIRMLAEGTLPPGYTVKRRRLVRIDGPADERPGAGKAGKKKDRAGKKKPGKGKKKAAVLDGAAQAA